MFASPSSSAPAPPPSGDNSASIPPHPAASVSENPKDTKRKRRPAGTPDPDAEVVSLSPRSLMESDPHVCDICNQGFQREQNLQMHRRRHKVPWKLVKREGPTEEATAPPRKRAFVCPEPSCVHHDPTHALGDLVGIKKHFRRKHSGVRQWACCRCSKAYAVHSDYKAHLKTCGTRGHSCDCGRVFSRVENLIEHQDACNAGGAGAKPQTTSSTSPPSDTNQIPTAQTIAVTGQSLTMPNPTPNFLHPDQTSSQTNYTRPHNLDLQLSIRPGDYLSPTEDLPSAAKHDAAEQLRIGMEERAMAEEARRQAKRNAELAEQEFSNAKLIRQQALAELDEACTVREEVAKRINSVLLDITCGDCRQQLADGGGVARQR